MQAKAHKIKIHNLKTDSVSRDNKELCPLNSSSVDYTLHMRCWYTLQSRAKTFLIVAEGQFPGDFLTLCVNYLSSWFKIWPFFFF